jgi:hypothetical protein
MTDVNGVALKFHAPPPPAPLGKATRLIRVSIGGFLIFAIGAGVMLAMPQIQRLLLAADTSRVASIRHLHGHHLRDAGEQFLHHRNPWQESFSPTQFFSPRRDTNEHEGRKVPRFSGFVF